MIRVETRFHNDAAVADQANLNGPAVHRWRLRRLSGFHNLHGHKLFRPGLAQPFLPGKKLRRANAALPAERRHVLPAPLLFRDQPAPLRPRLTPTLPHVPTVRHPAHVHKMGFT